MKRATLTLAALALLLGSVGQARAGNISWGAATGISGDGDVDTTGTLVAAFNLGAPGVPTTTVNGVTFVGLGLSGPLVTSGNFTFSLPTGWGNNNNVGSANTPFTSMSPSYQLLLQSIVGDFGTPATITMSGLTVGAQYEFEWWSSDSNGFQTLTTATAGNSVTLNINPR
jgi:hypothetical protein